MGKKITSEVTEIELVRIIECNQQVIKDNAAATLKSAEAMQRLSEVISGLQQVVTLLVTQITTSISQRADAVPIATHNKTVAVCLGIALFAILVAAFVVGLDLTGYGFGA
jgi:hypothetical protein